MAAVALLRGGFFLRGGFVPGAGAEGGPESLLPISLCCPRGTALEWPGREQGKEIQKPSLLPVTPLHLPSLHPSSALSLLLTFSLLLSSLQPFPLHPSSFPPPFPPRGLQGSAGTGTSLDSPLGHRELPCPCPLPVQGLGCACPQIPAGRAAPTPSGHLSPVNPGAEGILSLLSLPVPVSLPLAQFSFSFPSLSTFTPSRAVSEAVTPLRGFWGWCSPAFAPGFWGDEL